ncbi:hypothetical protein CONCODRAFT_4037 [Conidiobolus coronatus NRRL 28638]|uniref:Uncharacterized protein n=1 Tax=Conidiobolus coronatus (strain ATCC 28846 / CBS 209.66 / NRRL 28638) TaxID=796925 RepID=A0A137PDL2_CONC2|nr:hypothetical protein CONCODRAFT_4037 [Conidiobolus coronatus NRRL 28638]|eukprot:KXN73021.1 hypothetical protein CONCODRAFT_4037 [Conidiobolus coronatus NRRL 28638]
MKEGHIIGSVFWVENFNELLEKFGNNSLKRISNAIVHPYAAYQFNDDDDDNDEGEENKVYNLDFLFSMKIYQPEIIFKYNIDTYMENISIDVYNKLVKENLNSLVDNYIPSYKGCDGYADRNKGYIICWSCKCNRLNSMCYLIL